MVKIVGNDEALPSEMLVGIADALARAVDDPATFEDFVVAVMAASGRSVLLDDARFEQMVRDSLPILTFAVRARQAALAGYLEGIEGAALAIDDTGVIVHANSSARAGLVVEFNQGVEVLGVERAAFERFRRRLDTAAEGGTLLVGEKTPGDNFNLWWGRMLPAYGVICLTALASHWPESLSSFLSSEFGFSARDTAVLKSLANGRSIEAIAISDGKAIGTVRQSVKAVLSKLGVRSQAQAVALTSAIAAAGAPRIAERKLLPNDMQHFASYDRYGRQVAWRRYGVRLGAPILFVHGTLYGIGELHSERRLVQEFGFDVLACERPGYGRSLPCKVRNHTMQTALDDMLHALDEAGLGKVVVLAHDTGFAFAAALAVRAPDCVAGIVAVSPVVPMLSDSQTAGMPAQQRIFAWAAQRAPWLVEALTRIGVERMRRLGPTGWPHAVFANAERDKAVASDPDILSAVTSAYLYNATHSASGFISDVAIANSDWSDDANYLTCPVEMIHGTENFTVPLAAVEAFAERHPNFKLDVIEGEGHTLALASPQLGLRASFAMAVREGLI